MGLMNPADAVFLIPETRTSPMHVGGLQVYELPPDAAPDHVHKMYERLLAQTEGAPRLRRCPAGGRTGRRRRSGSGPGKRTTTSTSSTTCGTPRCPTRERCVSCSR